MQIVDVPLLRRLLIPIVSIPLAALLFHVQVSEGLVIRGDSEFYGGNTANANKFYQRARFFDRASSDAAERITTLGIMSHSAPFIHQALLVANDQLTRRPDDTIVRQNRALLEQKVSQPDRAYADWRVVAMQTKNPVIVEFTARDALRHHQIALAKLLYRRTLQLDPRRASARAALARLNAEIQ